MRLVYLLALLGALGCMVLIDRRFRLFFWRAPRRAATVLAVGLAFFLTWDLLGIAFGIFLRGPGKLSTGILIAPQLPLEEPFFLAFLCYVTMVLVIGARRVLDRARARR